MVAGRVASDRDRQKQASKFLLIIFFFLFFFFFFASFFFLKQKQPIPNKISLDVKREFWAGRSVATGLKGTESRGNRARNLLTATIPKNTGKVSRGDTDEAAIIQRCKMRLVGENEGGSSGREVWREDIRRRSSCDCLAKVRAVRLLSQRGSGAARERVHY